MDRSTGDPALIAAVIVSAMTTTHGKAFANALAKKDFAAISDLLHPEIDFRGLADASQQRQSMTPRNRQPRRS